jgi:hypothetical protein
MRGIFFLANRSGSLYATPAPSPGADLNKALDKAQEKEHRPVADHIVSDIHESLNGPMVPLKEAVGKDERDRYKEVEGHYNNRKGLMTQKVEHLVA